MPAPGMYKEWAASDQSRGLRAVNLAVRRGVLAPVKTVWCVHCMKMAQVYHHYAGYADEHLLDVIALCYKCHAVEHIRSGTYAGTTHGREKIITRRYHAGVPYKQLAKEYRATVTVIRKIVRIHSQPRLALLFP